MNRIVIDSELRAQLGELSACAELCDETGRTIGFFTPAANPADYEGLESELSEEELDRRSRESGRTLAEIMVDLHKLA